MKSTIYLVVYLLSTFLASANSNQTIDSTYYTIRIASVSPDGKWMAFPKFSSEEGKFYKYYLVNTDTKKKTETQHVTLLSNDIGAYLPSKTLTLIDLNRQANILELKNLSQRDVNPVKNIVFTLGEDQELNIFQVETKGTKNLFQTNGVRKYFLNPDKSYLIYQDDQDQKNLYKVDLKTFQKEFLTTVEKDINNVTWNIAQNAILFNLNSSNDLLLINLVDNQQRLIKLPTEKLYNLTNKFYTNNDILITYNIRSEQTYPETQYVDIWQGNSQQLFPSNFKLKYKFDHYAKVYKYDTKQSVDLERSRRKEYRPITTPGFVVYYDPIKGQDFLRTDKTNIYYIQNIETDSITFLSSYRQDLLHPSPDGKHLLYPKADTDYWEVLTPETNTRITIENDLPAFKAPIWSTDSKRLYFQQGNNLVELDLKTNKITKLSNFNENSEIDIINFSTLVNTRTKVVDNNRPIIFKVSINNQDAIYKNHKGKITPISLFSYNRINSNTITVKTTKLKREVITWVEENYNLPHTIFVYNKNNKKELLVETDIPAEAYNWQRLKFVKFQDNHGNNLEGALFYPKDFDPSKKYPMITCIYSNLWGASGTNPRLYIPPTYNNTTGYNRQLLNQEGYFVFSPATIVNENGPGLSALECVENAIEAVLEEEPAINREKIGLTGHSFGGYKTSFIATQTNLFAAIISNAGIHDLIGTYTYRFNNNFRQLPEYSRVETSQFAMQQSYGENPEKYINNSPLLHAHKIETPIMFFTGLEDHNIFWEQTRTMYSALKRYNNTATIALFYNNTDHSFNQTIQQKEATDYTKRTLDWWDYYLKDNKSIQWIDDAVNPDKISMTHLDNQ